MKKRVQICLKKLNELGVLWSLISLAFFLFILLNQGASWALVTAVGFPFVLAFLCFLYSMVKKTTLLSSSLFTLGGCSAILFIFEIGVITPNMVSITANAISLSLVIGCLLILGNQKNKYKK